MTLLRAVGELGDWGDFPTPDAQCQESYVFDYALIPHAGPFECARAQQEAFGFNHAPDSVATGVHPGPLPPVGSFLQLDPEVLVLSALKKAEARDSLIVRFYNPHPQAVAARLSTPWDLREAHRTNLDERRLEPVPVRDGGVRIEAGAKQIITLELVPHRAR